MRQEVLEALRTPFDRSLIRSRRGQGGRNYHYVRCKDYIDRLNSLPCGWEFVIDEIRVINDTDVLARGHLLIDGETRSDVGGATMVMSQDGEIIGNLPDLAKKAVSDLLKRCSRHFALGNSLWATDEDAERLSGGDRHPNNNGNGRSHNGRGRANGNGRGNGGASNGNRLTARQMTALFSMARSLGKNAETLRDETSRRYGCPPEQLSKSQASEMIQDMGEALGQQAGARP